MQQVCLELSNLARELGAGAKLPTVVELRSSLGVSLTTLSGALDLLEKRGIIERVHGHGIFVAQNHALSPRIAVICEQNFLANQTSPFWKILMESVEDRARRADETLETHFAQSHGVDVTAPLLASPQGLQPSLVADIEAGRIAGVLGIGLPLTQSFWLRDQKIPFVAFAAMGRGMVTTDRAQLLEKGLAELGRLGCRRVGVGVIVLPHLVFLDRLQRVRGQYEQLHSQVAEFCARFGLEFSPELIGDDREFLEEALRAENLDFLRRVRGRVSPQEFGFELVQKWWRLPAEKRPDGLIFGVDLCTHGALAALRQLGVEPGRDVQIATHSNWHSPLLMGHDHHLIRLEYDTYEIVNALFEMLEAQIGGETMHEVQRPVFPHLRRPTQPDSF